MMPEHSEADLREWRNKIHSSHNLHCLMGDLMQLQVLFYSEDLFRDLVTGNKVSD